MRAITFTQPIPSLIVLGAKRVETRGAGFPKPHVGERIAIHAAKGLGGLDELTQALPGLAHLDGLHGLPALRAVCGTPHFAAALTPIAYRAGAGQRLLNDAAAVDWGSALPRGAVLAVARVAGVEQAADVADQVKAGQVDAYGAVGVDEHRFGVYGPGRLAIFLEHVTSIEPVPCGGALGLWALPAHVEPQVLRQLHGEADENVTEAVRNPLVAVGAGVGVRDRTAASDRRTA